MAKKPDLDDATIQIARRMLSTSPKRHEEMKVGKSRASKKRKDDLESNKTKKRS